MNDRERVNHRVRVNDRERANYRERVTRRMHVPGRLLLGALAVSGASSLVYQVVWFRALALTFGVTAYALSVVLAAFMLGLALGAVAGGRRAERARAPLRDFAVVEVATAVLGLGTLPMLRVVGDLYVASLPSGAMVATTALWGLSFLVLVLPAAFMGMTLPLAARATAGGGASVGTLYAANTAGAVCGTLVAGFLLLGTAGLRASVFVAALGNLATTALLLLAMREQRNGVLRESRGSTTEVEGLDDANVPTSLRALGVTSLAVAGLTALGYEVLWVRLFSVVSAGIVYAFTVMLATLLAGVALGSFLYERVAAGRAPAGRRITVDSARASTHMAWLQVALGLTVATCLLWIPALVQNLAVRGATASLLGGTALERCPTCAIGLPALLTMVFVASVLSGATFPAAARAMGAAGSTPARLGVGYAANVAGSVLGSLLAGLALLPLLGAHRSFLVLAALNVAFGIGVFVVQRRRLAVATATVAAVAVMAVAAQARVVPDLYRALVQGRLGAAATIIWHEEGVESSVAVGRRESGERWLLINGEIHGDTRGAAYHRTLGLLGVLLHPAPTDVLVIGVGGGVTAGAVALHPDTRVHIVELSPGALAGARMLADINDAVLDNPRVTTEIGDGRHHLLAGGRRYDVIVADTIRPRHAGASLMYSLDFFALARERLKPGGLMVQWLGTPQEPREYRWAARTFAAAFPHTTFWLGGDIGVGSLEPQALPGESAFGSLVVRTPALSRTLRELELASLAELRALEASSVVKSRVDAGPVVTDDRPVLEYFLTLNLLQRMADAWH